MIILIVLLRALTSESMYMAFLPDEEVVIKDIIINGNEYAAFPCKVIGYQRGGTDRGKVIVILNETILTFNEDKLENSTAYYRRIKHAD